MTNLFAEEFSRIADMKLTENEALAYTRPSDSELLTLFGVIGSLRPRSEQEIIDMFAAAYAEDQLLATKMLFYAGDIRGGLGERRTFKILLNWLAKNDPVIVVKNMENIPFYNRFDAWYALLDTDAEAAMWTEMYRQLGEDVKNQNAGKPISLLTKWMKSLNTSSPASRELGRRTFEALKKIEPTLTEKKYRQFLSKFRKYLKIVERYMSINEWNDIDYAIVPSYAMKNYSNAFLKHDETRFEKYIKDVKKGREKVNAGVLYPYDLVKPYLSRDNEILDDLVDEQWKALPNYIEGQEDLNILCMVDVSGSMNSPNHRPIASSIGLGLYFAERAKGAFKNLYMTFTNSPRFIKVNPASPLRQKVRQVFNTDIGYNTNLEAAFLAILEMGIEKNIPQEDMPDALIVLSDNEIDRFNTDAFKDNYGYWGSYPNWNRDDFVTTMAKRFAVAGYTLPKLVFFQLESRQNTFLSQDPNVLWVSGQSPSVFKSILRNIAGEATDLMLDTLNDKRYDRVVI